MDYVSGYFIGDKVKSYEHLDYILSEDEDEKIVNLRKFNIRKFNKPFVMLRLFVRDIH